MSACTRRQAGSEKLSGSRNGRCCRPRPGWIVSGSPRTEAYIEACINTHNIYYVKLWINVELFYSGGFLSIFYYYVKILPIGRNILMVLVNSL